MRDNLSSTGKLNWFSWPAFTVNSNVPLCVSVLKGASVSSEQYADQACLGSARLDRSAQGRGGPGSCPLSHYLSSSSPVERRRVSQCQCCLSGSLQIARSLDPFHDPFHASNNNKTQPNTITFGRSSSWTHLRSISLELS